ncbi:hypothetical protein [Mycolicibacterium farcinogenes]|uniref:Uncharacterized protein n=1 Tax=Mycolicibacterium farcinogenes TaxID=1802 RepID=A0ACD1FRF4_MYCFR|nr:hypothetical protein [Mycolicibacterium farcinogenes]QZH69595.1 hypothetical protein K6L26_31530 [Mycolicibacterium farcinogenes]
MTAAVPLGEDPMPKELSCEDLADERPVVVTKFPETRSRPPWQFLLDDIESKLQELRMAVESILAAVLPFLHSTAEDPCWTCDDAADPGEVKVTVLPDK